MPRDRNTNQHTKDGTEAGETVTTLPRHPRDWQTRYRMRLLVCGQQIRKGTGLEATGTCSKHALQWPT